MSLAELPELRSLESGSELIRIPSQLDVPLTARVRALVDTADFRRLGRVSQLGLVSLVYPAAHHTRLEHSLGVYRNGLLFLRQLAREPRFAAVVGAEEAAAFIAASLLHDIGHWPFCHPIEDIRLPGVPRHEDFAARYLLEGPLARMLEQQWGLQPHRVLELIAGPPSDPAGRLLASLLSGPIDIDKLDYLYRDSLHAGVPYGMNFDAPRLIRSLCLNQQGDGLALLDKGRTAAELMVFARYVMFSEVYWHRTVRAATAMLQRAFYELASQPEPLDWEPLFAADEPQVIALLRGRAQGLPADRLLDGLFGPTRSLHKTLAEFSDFQQPDLYHQLARRGYPWQVRCSQRLAETLGPLAKRPIQPLEVLFDAPPLKLEVQFNIQLFDRQAAVYRQLGEVSPVVETLARRQFDDYVKRVRVFVSPPLRETLRTVPRGQIEDAIAQAASLTTADTAVENPAKDFLPQPDSSS